MDAAKDITSYRKYWAARFGTAPFLPMSRAEMDALGWDSCDIILVTGDAYVDHPSFGMAIIGRVLEAQGFPRRASSRSPTGTAPSPSRRWGGRTCSSASPPATWIRWSTATRRTGASAATTPTRPAAGGKRPDRSVIVYAQRCARGLQRRARSSSAASRRACAASRTTTTGRRRCAARSCSTPRRTCWSTATPSAQIVEIAHRLAAGESIADITDLRGTAFVRAAGPVRLD